MPNTKHSSAATRRNFLQRAACAAFFGAFPLGSRSLLRAAESAEPRVSLTLRKQYKRDVNSYTQGLLYEFDAELGRGVLYESGGQYGRSLLRKVDAETGEVLQKVAIPRVYFAEGLAAVDDRLYLLTWRENACLVYDKKTFKKIDEYRYPGEGWGLAFDGARLVMSDGSSKIRILDPDGFRLKQTIDVHFKNASGARRPIYYLNELEMVNGEIWANVYQREYVVRINPRTGGMIGAQLNFSSLTPKNLKNDLELVLNGLAFDKENGRLFVTGKRWPVVYILDVVMSKKETKNEPQEDATDAAEQSASTPFGRVNSMGKYAV